MRIRLILVALYIAFALTIWPLDLWRYVLAVIIFVAAVTLED